MGGRKPSTSRSSSTAAITKQATKEGEAHEESDHIWNVRPSAPGPCAPAGTRQALGDYLVVGVTADGFDKVRGKINVSQTLNERMRSVQELGIADEVIVEEYEGQKIDDIRRMGIDVFTVGSDWLVSSTISGNTVRWSTLIVRKASRAPSFAPKVDIYEWGTWASVC